VSAWAPLEQIGGQQVRRREPSGSRLRAFGGLVEPRNNAVEYFDCTPPGQSLQGIDADPDQAADEVMVTAPVRAAEELDERLIDLFAGVLVASFEEASFEVRGRPRHACEAAIQPRRLVRRGDGLCGLVEATSADLVGPFDEARLGQVGEEDREPGLPLGKRRIFDPLAFRAA